MNSGPWNQDELDRFDEALRQYGKDWAKVKEHVGTRDRASIGSKAQAIFNRIRKSGKLLKDVYGWDHEPDAGHQRQKVPKPRID